MDRSEQLELVAGDVGRSVYFVWRLYGRLPEFCPHELLDELADAALKLRNVELELLKLTGRPSATSGQEHLFDDAGQRLPF
jgi:hypothetical protein